MLKIDLKKELKHLYSASTRKVALVDVPAMNFLLIDGRGDPETSTDFQDAIEAIYSVSYTLKFNSKKAEIADFGVMPLEGLWWTETEEYDFENRDNWQWTLMILQPEFIDRLLFERAVAEVHRKKGLAALFRMRFEKFYEGKAAQIMHIGPFSAERPAISKVQAFIADTGLQPAGKHHEIYLSDFRRAAPEKLKTIIRQPCL